MDALYPELARRFEPAKLVGYLNFSDGRPDPKWRKLIADLFGYLIEQGNSAPGETVGAWLAFAASQLAEAGTAAFRDTTQARTVIEAAFVQLPRTMLTERADLLSGQDTDFLFPAFFYTKAAEAVLRERARIPLADAEALARAACTALCDYVGYRPSPQLESKATADIYPGEKVFPIPLFLDGTGVAPGIYADLLRPALDLLRQTEPILLEEAGLDPALIEELSVDPRPVDHFHPITKRPSSLFGEWDPHRIDDRGNYRRFVVRSTTLDALLRWMTEGTQDRRGERQFEAAAALAGTIMMGAGISGSGPSAHDSNVTLATLVPRVARYRDGFYQRLLKAVPGPHGERLRAEAEKRKQPFAAVRQFLNAAIAADRALHLQERRLSLFFASMGYPQAARQRAMRISSPATRFECEIRLRQVEALRAVENNQFDASEKLLSEVENLLHRGIDCGAMIDPWNILGYQGLFPIFTGRDDTVRDPRTEELIYLVGRQLDVYASALAASGTVVDDTRKTRLTARMTAFANWWDTFATTTVPDLPRVQGNERSEAASHVANALGLWRSGGATDPAFWRAHRDGFRTPAAFAHVVDALLDHGDFKAAMALLITWLGEADIVPLQDASASFFRLAFRWLNATMAADMDSSEKSTLIRRFFELLEANAEDRWEVPKLSQIERSNRDTENPQEASEDDDVGFDTSDDGGVAEDKGYEPDEFPLESDSERLQEGLRFLAAVARLWRQASTLETWPTIETQTATTLYDSATTANRNHRELLNFLNELDNVVVPTPKGGVDGIIEYDRRRMLKGSLLEVATATTVETAAAARALAALFAGAEELPPAKSSSVPQLTDDRTTPWLRIAIRLERAMALAQPETVKSLLPTFIALFRAEPLLVHPSSEGGKPEPAVRAQIAQQVLESLLTKLPRLGLLRETYQLTKLAWAMERNEPPAGKRVSSFDQLFRTAVTSVVESLLSSAKIWKTDSALRIPGESHDPDPLAGALRHIAESFHTLWLQHSQSLRLSALEPALDAEEWNALKTFVRSYGKDLFTVRFLSLSNVRGILSQGVTTWLDQLAEVDNDKVAYGETRQPKPKIVRHWASEELNKPKTARYLETVLQALVEFYDEYRDYNTTTTQSDYGDNLYILLDILRLKVAYERYAWRLRPLTLAHDVLCRRGYNELAGKWREFIRSKTYRLADELLGELTEREQEHGLRLRTVRDRLEERFLLPLTIDRIVAMVAPAAAAARAGATESHPAFQSLEEAVSPLAESPAGVGLDVPVWLRRMEEELRKLHNALPTEEDEEIRTEDSLTLPNMPFDFDTLRQQLQDWDKPLAE